MDDCKIIVDSGCDMTPQLERRLGVTSVPMTICLGKKEYCDDDTLDLPGFMADMKACKEKAGSASPNPFSFMEAIRAAKRSFVVTISGKLSNTYGSAMLGKEYANENGEADTHVFDSKSASAGEVLVAVKIRELLLIGTSKEQIIKTVNEFIDNMKTYFVLERYDNLMKNGRLGKITGKIINALNIKLIMGSDGDGSIVLHAKVRGTRNMLDKIIDFIKDSGRPTMGESFVICHCNNLPLATQISNAVKSNFDFKEIITVPARGLVSLYADDKGVVVAF